MLGLSAGGHIAYYAATQVRFAALVVFYPGWLTGTDIALSRPEPTLALTPRLADLRTPVLFFLGAADHLFSVADRDQIAAELAAARVEHELIVYPDTPHGFFCDERDTYRAAPAVDAWSRTRQLLAAGLGRGD
jgi:carboxymethylenebutenolidase